MAVANNSQVQATGVIYTDNVTGSITETISRNGVGVVPNKALRTKSQYVSTRVNRLGQEDGLDYLANKTVKTVQVKY